MVSLVGNGQKLGLRMTTRNLAFSCPHQCSKVPVGSHGDSFGTLPLGVEDKVLFHDYDFQPEDQDEQDKHEAKIADVLRPGPEDYLKRINHLIHKKKDLRSALAVLPEMKEERVKPLQPHFRILIYACAKAGHTAKAFELYRQFRLRALPRHVGIYVDLFESCALGSNMKLGLDNATWLRKKLAEDHFIPSVVLYHTMIKAFGRCGDLETAFELVDEMSGNGQRPTTETMAHLLQGCLSDQSNGFRHALLVWRRMRRRQIRPNLFTYNLMLRAAAGCKLGNLSHTQDILQACLPVDSKGKLILPTVFVHARGKGVLGGQDTPVKPSQHGNAVGVVDNEERGIEVLSIKERMDILGVVESEEERSEKNLLVKRPNVSNVVSLAPEDTAENRLALMGGTEGFLQIMAKDRVTPDIKTLSFLLAAAPNTREVEAEVLSLITTLSITPTVSFFNQMIKARVQRRDFALGRATLDEMNKHGLTPDVQTFGVLAMCCRDSKECIQFLSELEALGATLNNEILGALVGSLAYAHDPIGVMRMMQAGERHGLRPSPRFIHIVEKFFQHYRGMVKQGERGERLPWRVEREAEAGWQNWTQFSHFYKQWLMRVKPDLTTDPMEQYESKQGEVKSGVVEAVQRRHKGRGIKTNNNSRDISR